MMLGVLRAVRNTTVFKVFILKILRAEQCMQTYSCNLVYAIILLVYVTRPARISGPFVENFRLRRPYMGPV